jgi:hypothetical protein
MHQNFIAACGNAVPFLDLAPGSLLADTATHFGQGRRIFVVNGLLRQEKEELRGNRHALTPFGER